MANIQPGAYSRLAPIKAAPIVNIVQHSLFGMSLIFFLSGLWMEDCIMQFVGVFVMLISNTVYAILRLKTRLFSLFLYLGMFLFWLSRPLFGILYFQNNAWRNNGEPALQFALLAILLTMFFVRLGTVAYEWLLEMRRSNGRGEALSLRLTPHGKTSSIWGRHRGDAVGKAVRTASLLVYVVCVIGSVVYSYQQLSFARTISYEEYYLSSSSMYASGIASILDTMTPYVMCIFLATLPSKRSSTVVLLINAALAGPELMIGIRGPFVLAAMFLALYYLLRACVCQEDGWITKFEIALVCIGVPLGIFAMGAMNYIRGSRDIAPESILGTFFDALYKQGVTFSVLQFAYNVDPLVQSLGFKFYTLGSLTNNITQGFIGQLFLGAELLPESNSIDLATKGTLYSHAMSYFAHWNYLHGGGYGTSYILEAYADFGYGGIIGVSLLFGFVFSFLSHRARDGGFVSTAFALLSARWVFYLPRDEAADWISFLWSTRFWMAAIIVAVLGFFLLYRFEAIPARKQSGNVTMAEP